MGNIELILLGIGLSMDAVAITITNSLCYKDLKLKDKISMPIAFGLFQGGMPLLGFFAGGLFAFYINKYAGIITLLILGYIGISMIKDAIEERKNPQECPPNNTYGFKVLIIQAIASSIDAFAIGVSLAAQNTNILYASSIIAITTMLFCILALWIGNKFGSMLGEKAQIFGGIILLIIGIKAIL